MNDYKWILQNSNLVDYFLELVRIDTQSDPYSSTVPSTKKQYNGLSAVRKLLINIGMNESDIFTSEYGYLYAKIHASPYISTEKKIPTLCFISHIDTSPDFIGYNVKPQLHNNYNGKPISLNENTVIEVSKHLEKCCGDTIITSDGSTLLGADDKAGVAELLAVAQILLTTPSILRPNIYIIITPDEEIGNGAQHLDLDLVNADCAYTIDGSHEGEINIETFSADSAKIEFTGVSVHPGFGKGKLVNALRYASKFISMLPMNESPEQTENREGFFHPISINGNASQAKVEMILRDFDDKKLEYRGEFLRNVVGSLLNEEPRLQAKVTITPSYRNMGPIIKKHNVIISRLIKAVEKSGCVVDIVPIRGGTDGSRLTERGLPTPNIFTGGLEFHGPREWISTRVMALAVCTILNLLEIWMNEDKIN